MVRFKIGFTINAETLFSLMSQMLPIDNLSVEEVIERDAALERRVIAPAPAPAPTLRKKKKRPVRGPLLDRGINRIILDILEDGAPHRAVEMQQPIQKAGFSANSVGSRLQCLREHGVVEQLGDGGWQLTKSSVDRAVRDMVA
jgi:hypothetical protein